MKKLYLIICLIMLAVMATVSACAAEAPATTYRPQTTQPAMTSAPRTTIASTRPNVPAPTMTVPSATGADSYKQETIGLATGGAKDIQNFRDNVENGYLPLPTDITYEGLFYDYYFDTGIQEPADKLFAPSYSYAVTRDPLSKQTEYYLSVGLNSGLKEEDFTRKKLNLAIVLDISGSMSSDYQEYYYDQSGEWKSAYEDEGITRLNKMESASDAVVSILNQLESGDRFSIVLFNNNASLMKSMGLVRNTDMYKIKDQVLDLNAGGSTNLIAGLNLATEQFRNLREVNSYDYENRIIVLTDAQPNTGDYSASGLTNTITNNAKNRIYTTFIGIGVDFNTELIEAISKTKGANYYSVHSPGQFRERVDEEFDYMVTPLVFDLRLNFESEGWRIEKVFGSPEADQSTGQLMKINTLFPSRSEGGENKGGIVVLKLRKMDLEAGGKVYLKVTYEDRDGRTDSSRETIYLEGTSPEYFQNSGIRKAILLSRYAALLQNWTLDERSHVNYGKTWEPTVREDTGIVIPSNPYLSQWERTSLPLTVSGLYESIFGKFKLYFADEMREIGDTTLEQELDILDVLDK